MQKLFGSFLIVVSLVVAAIFVGSTITAEYQYTNSVGNYWTLADRASTIAQKSEYMDKFVAAFGDKNLAGVNDAIFFPTPTNSFDANFEALKSLQGRLHQISGMDESSFAYQTAIQQITAQEQGQAGDMLLILKDCWFKVNHYWLWNDFINAAIIFGSILGIILGCAIISDDDY